MPAPALLYVKAGCPHCDRARNALVAAGTVFREIDVEAQPQAIPELMKLTKGRRVVPVIVGANGIEVAPEGGSAF